MQLPVIQITFRDDLPHTEAVETHIREKIQKLQHYCDKIVSCHVVVEMVHQKKQQCNWVNTRLTVAVTGKTLVSSQNANENMYVSIQEAFQDMTRELENYASELRGEIKHPEVMRSGKVARMLDGFGFIEGNDGVEYYFNEAHVPHAMFPSLGIGSSVHFVVGMGTEGPEAHRVRSNS